MSPARDERPTGRAAAPRGLAVSVVVPVYNGGTLVEGCLRALDTQTLEANRYEVVVVDDGSTDDTVARVRAFAGRCAIVLVEQVTNKGPAAARNAGIAAATADVIAFTDVDCEPAPDWLERALDALAAHGEAPAVEGRTEPKGEPTALTHQMINRTGGLWMTCN
ncbi:MAG: glycosyltransferase family 2 protein, partial [Actinomycetota bacterium]